MHFTKSKKQNSKEDILSDSTYMTYGKGKTTGMEYISVFARGCCWPRGFAT